MNKVREIRSQRDLSGNELALLAGIQPGHLSLIERGQRPSKQTADKIASALQMSGQDLWADEYATLRGS